jgi:peptidylprolyl isomerase
MTDEEIIETATGLGYVDLVEGTGPMPKTGESVRVHYTGWLKSGTKFDSSHDRKEPLVFPIGKGRVIKGWDEGVGTMKVGGKRKLVIPAHLGYGQQGAGGVIPPGATLIFEVELLGIDK